MRKVISQRFLLATMFAMPLTALAAPPSSVGPPPTSAPAEDTVLVDCTKGDSIADAMNNAAGFLTIEISGVCVEDVVVSRNNVTFRGASGDATLDGIQGDPNSFSPRPVSIFAKSVINFENLHFTGGSVGIGINASFSVSVTDSIIHDNDFAGMIVGSAAGSINIQNTVITADPANPNGLRLRIGIWAANGAQARCRGCTIENYRTGMLATTGSDVEISDYNPAPGDPDISANVSGTRSAVAITTGGNLRSTNASLTGGPGTGFFRGGIWADGGATASVTGGSLTGRLVALQESNIRLNGVIQDNNGIDSTFSGNSSAVFTGSSSLTGLFDFQDFSNASLHDGSTISGALQCSRGAVAHCDTPGDVSGGAASCGQCQ